MKRYITTTASSADTQYDLNWGYLQKPYVVYQEDEQIIDFNSLSASPNTYAQQYLTMTSTNQFRFKLQTNTGGSRNIYLEYSIDGGSWTTLSYSTYSEYIPSNSVVRIRGDIGWVSSGESQNSRFTIDGSDVHMYGNILSVIYGDDFVFRTDVPSYCFCYAFSNCNALTNIDNLVMPGSSENCYYKTFSNCSGLTSANVILPAKSLARNCYNRMFFKCTSLTSAPQLPATTLAYSCYDSMFSGCTSLTSAPQLPATVMADGCYGSMFAGCTGLTSAPVLSATTLADRCYQSMFYGCTGLVTAPELPATTLANFCYGNMFEGCTALTTAPELPATTLADFCYFFMFSNCSSLNYIKCLATNISASLCTYYWVSGVASTGTFVKNSNMSSWTTDDNGIPSGWTVVDSE